MLLCENYRSFWFGRSLCSTHSDIQLFRLQLLHLLFEELLSENVRRGGRRNCGGEKLPLFAQPYVQEPQELGAGGEEVSSDMCWSFSPQIGIKGCNWTVSCLAAKGGMEQGLWWDGGIALACCALLGGHLAVSCCRGCSSSGPAPHILFSQFWCPACLSATALWLFLYTVRVPCSLYSCLSSGMCWFFHLSFTHSNVCFLFLILCFPWECHFSDFFFCLPHSFENGWVKKEQAGSKY